MERELRRKGHRENVFNVNYMTQKKEEEEPDIGRKYNKNKNKKLKA